MALCFTHATAGYLAYEAARPAGGHRLGLFAAAVGLATAPDLDFVPGLLIGQPGVYHRGVTHTLAAVIVVALVTALLVRGLGGRGAPWARGGVWAGAVWASHLLVDFFTTDVVPPYGARFLWPLSEAHWIAPVTPLPEVVIDPTGRVAFLASIVGPETAGVWAGEIGLLALMVAAVHALRARRAFAPRRRAEETP